MIKTIVDAWHNLTGWFDKRVKGKTLSEVIEEEDKLDDQEIELAERTIVNHQYLAHMAHARQRARKEWRRAQHEKYGEAARNVRSLPAVSEARRKLS